jgi:hypothetical protein
MLHKPKDVIERFKKRFIGLFRYIADYEILLFSLIYLFSTYLYLLLLRNIEGGVTIGSVCIGSIVVLSFSVRFFLLRNIKKRKEGEEDGAKDSKRNVHFFGMWFLPVVAISFAFIRISPILAKEAMFAEGSLCFTNEKVSFEGFLYDEPDKKYIKQALHIKQLQDISVERQVLD